MFDTTHVFRWAQLANGENPVLQTANRPMLNLPPKWKTVPTIKMWQYEDEPVRIKKDPDEKEILFTTTDNSVPCEKCGNLLFYKVKNALRVECTECFTPVEFPE